MLHSDDFQGDHWVNKKLSKSKKNLALGLFMSMVISSYAIFYHGVPDNTSIKQNINLADFSGSSSGNQTQKCDDHFEKYGSIWCQKNQRDIFMSGEPPGQSPGNPIGGENQTRDECLKTCKDYEGCVAITYWGDNGMCYLYLAVPETLTHWDANFASYIIQTKPKEKPTVNFCAIQEQFNEHGPYRCVELTECKGKRTCNDDGWCSGDSMCEKPHPCHIDESLLSQGKCVSAIDCKGSRECFDEKCTGESGCPSKKSCLHEETSNKGYKVIQKKNSRCKYDFDCQGLRTCSSQGWGKDQGQCQGESGCGLTDDFCKIDESINYLGSGRCKSDVHCAGKRNCEVFGGRCQGQSFC